MSRLEQALPSDGPALLELIEAAPAKGNIRLLYTRRPDAYASLHREGGQVSVSILRGEDGRPDFMACCTLRPHYLDGRAATLGYLGGVRRRENVPLRGNWVRELAAREGPRADAWLLSILEGNGETLHLAGKPRAHIPRLVPLCGYTTWLLNPRALAAHAAKLRGADGDTPIPRAVRPEDLPEVHRFLADCGRRYQFFPAVTDLEAQFPDLAPEDCFVLREQGKIAAFGALWDQSGYRQYIVREYRGPMKLARLAGPLLKTMGYIPLPPPGATLPLATLSLLATRDDSPGRLAALLQGMAAAAQRRGYGALVAGTAEGHWQEGLFRGARHLSFGSRIYRIEAGQQAGGPAREALPIHLECGLL